jgi:hypothetical protein
MLSPKKLCKLQKGWLLSTNGLKDMRVLHTIYISINDLGSSILEIVFFWFLEIFVFP